jgi:uncharacterized protein (TIGR02246 family)
MASLAAGPDEIIQTIRAMDECFVRTLCARNTEAIVADYYAEDARVLPPGQPVVEGREAIRRYWDKLLGCGMQGLALDTTHVEVSGNLAYAVGQYTMSLEPEGRAVASKTGKYLVVYRRQDSHTWRVVVDMFSGDGD